MDQFEIKSDITSNRLFVLLKGFFLESEVDLAMEKLVCELKKLRFGLDIIIDLTKMITKPDYVRDLFYEQIIIRTRSESRYIFRVTNKYKIIESLKNYGKSGPEANTRIKYINSVEEAEYFLEHTCILKNIHYN